MYQALIDTGASSTCLSAKVVSEAGLVPTGKTMMQGATGASATNQYSFGVGFPFNQRVEPSGTATFDMEVKAVQGLEFASAGGAFEILLGRDIICQGVLTLSWDGHFSLSF